MEDGEFSPLIVKKDKDKVGNELSLNVEGSVEILVNDEKKKKDFQNQFKEFLTQDRHIIKDIKIMDVLDWRIKEKVI
jgi:hypothetical protein